MNNNQVVVITGASSGIGAALGELLAARGVDVVLVARRKEALEAVAAKCHGRALVVTGDMGVRADVQRVVRSALERFGHIDVLVNNAGQGITRVPSQLTDQDIDDMVRINVKSVLYGMQELLPHFKARGTGHIINISSMLGRLPVVPVRSAYCGSKHFVNALTALFRAEVQLTHPEIQVTLLSPGVVHTDFGLNAIHGGPDSRSFPDGQSAEQVAEVIAGAIESRLPDVYTFQGAHDRVATYYAANGVDP
jgi:NADP-dependent 3-hydroxy acid dehydrogenase YdfG